MPSYLQDILIYHRINNYDILLKCIYLSRLNHFMSFSINIYIIILFIKSYMELIEKMQQHLKIILKKNIYYCIFGRLQLMYGKLN